MLADSFSDMNKIPWQLKGQKNNYIIGAKNIRLVYPAFIISWISLRVREILLCFW